MLLVRREVIYIMLFWAIFSPSDPLKSPIYKEIKSRTHIHLIVSPKIYTSSEMYLKLICSGNALNPTWTRGPPPPPTHFLR